MGRLQVSHTPNACRSMRANASSIARRSRLRVWCKWSRRSAWAASVAWSITSTWRSLGPLPRLLFRLPPPRSHDAWPVTTVCIGPSLSRSRCCFCLGAINALLSGAYRTRAASLQNAHHERHARLLRAFSDYREAGVDILHPGHLPPGLVEKVKRKSAKSPYFFSSVARLGRGQQASTASPPLSGRVHLPSRPHPAHRESDPTRSESVGEFLVAPNTRVMPAPLPNRSSPT